MLARYCDAQCQRRHWAEHRAVCPREFAPGFHGARTPVDRLTNVRHMTWRMSADSDVTAPPPPDPVTAAEAARVAGNVFFQQARYPEVRPGVKHSAVL
jgi:hypothetical protein